MLKRTLFSLLAALMTTSAYAAPLNPDDWMTIDDTAEGCFTFSDGKLNVTGNTGGRELYYKVEEGTNLMLNGSAMSITLQFDNDKFKEDENTGFYIAFHNNNSDIDGDDFFHRFYVFNSGSLNLYDSVTHDDYYDLDPASGITTIKVNYSIQNNHLCLSYELNGVASTHYVYQGAKVNSALEWRPCFGTSGTETNVFTVTDVTFNPIPEPATATLSLLALAGLAARRRRQ